MKDDKRKILMVDDEDSYLDIYATKLGLAGYTVVATKDGLGAVDMAVKECPDAILLDLLMPDIDGYEVLRCLKENEATKHIPVIVLSVLNRENDVKEAMKGGAVCYLVKSDLTPQQIIDELQRCMK